MSNYSDGRYIDRIAGADLSALTNLFRIVSLQADSTNSTGRSVILATSHTDANIFGVLNNNPKAGETANVVGRNANGTFKVVIGANSAAVSVNDFLTVDTDSGALKTTTGSDQIIGRAQEAGVAGQVIEYLPVNYKY